MKYFSPREFAEAIGVSESSVRRWADRGKIAITKTEGGHRKIAQSEALRFVRETQTNVAHPELLELTSETSEEETNQQILSALESGDETQLNRLLRGLYLQGESVASICDGPLRFALQQIGSRWPEDDRAIFVEHRATALVHRALVQLRQHLPALSDGAPLAIGAAPSDDPYLLPSMMAATTLADVGFRDMNLGPNTPLEVLGEAAQEEKASLIWVAITAPLKSPRGNQAIQQLAKAAQDIGAVLVLGGRSANLPPHKQPSNVQLFGSMTEMAAFAKGLAIRGAWNSDS